jgi:beta-glucosidase
VTDADDIVNRLDLAAKVRLLSGRGFWMVEPVPEAGLEPIVLSDGPHGLRTQVGAGDHLGLAGSRPATCFPPAVTLGSSWDEALAAEVGAALGAEARSQGVSVVLGPGLNLKRHPAGGRNFEYYAEDPVLAGRLAAANVRGIQSQGVGASMKHFAVNNQESHRLVVDVRIDERTLRELYLTGFEIVVTESRPWTVMSSYNRINGTYAGDSRELLTTILRDEWGFDGLVMSDWGGTNDRVAGVRAGLDLEMPGSHGAFDAEVLAAVHDGRLAEAEVDRCATRVVALLQRGQPGGPPPTVDLDAHHALARRAAAGGTVLLTNKGVLPLRATGRIAVVGAFAAEPRYQGAGSSQVSATRIDAALDALRARAGHGEHGRDGAIITYAPGYDTRTGTSTPDQLAEALAVARDADVVVCFAGLPAAAESEGFDRSTIDLPADHVHLIEALATLAVPVVVVLSNGGVVHLPWADRVDAIVETWLGGQAGGAAVVDVLFGDAEPGGRLAESIPHHVAQLPADRSFPGHPRQVRYHEGLSVGYRFHDSAGVPAHFAFGHGLSYTTFEWTDIEITGDGTDHTVTVTVTNTGDRPGSDVVEVYVRDVESSVARPDKELKGFAKVHLAPGERDRVEVRLGRRAFAVWDVDAHDWLVEAGAFEIVVARSSVDPVATLTVEVASPDHLGADPRPWARAATDAELAEMCRQPLPDPDPLRRFHRNSTLEDIATTPLGRLISAIVIREGMKRARQEFPDPDDATIRMVGAALREGPLRSLAILSGGIITLTQMDALISLLERDPAGIVRAFQRRTH